MQTCRPKTRVGRRAADGRQRCVVVVTREDEGSSPAVLQGQASEQASKQAAVGDEPDNCSVVGRGCSRDAEELQKSCREPLAGLGTLRQVWRTPG